MAVNQGGKDAMENCAMCTIAAIVGVNTSTVAQAIGASGQTDEHLAKAFGASGESHAQLQMVLNNMIRLVEQWMAHGKTSVKGCQYGVPGIYKTLPEIKQYMQSKKTGTAFAVWGCESGLAGEGAHWNFATTMSPDKRVEFRDYQDNTGDDKPAKISGDFIPRAEARDEKNLYCRFIVLSFELE